jgi:hypothetical protein
MGSLRSLNKKKRKSSPSKTGKPSVIIEPTPRHGHPGKNWFEAAVVYAPYLPLFVTDASPQEYSGDEVIIEGILVM